MNSLDDVRIYLQGIPRIHQGGCAISALAMKRWLKNNKPKEKTFIIYIYYGEHSFDTNEDFIKGKRSTPGSCTHALLSYKGECMDCTDIEYPHDSDYLHIIKDEEFIVKSINILNHWNSYFNRKYIKKIADDLDIDLNDIDETWKIK